MTGWVKGGQGVWGVGGVVRRDTSGLGVGEEWAGWVRGTRVDW